MPIISGSDKELGIDGVTRREILAGSGALATASLTGCLGDDDDGGNGNGEESVEVHMTLLEASMYIPPILYANDEGLWDDIGMDFSFEVVGFGQFTRQYTDDLTTGSSTLSALPLVEQAATGTDVRIFGQTMNFINQCFVPTDSDIESPEDLVGGTLGVPGLGSSTTRTYIAQWQEEFGIDIEEDMEVVDAPTGALFNFLQQGKEVDAAILFTSFTIAALASEDTRSIYKPTEGWQEQTGYPPAVNLWGVFDDFLEEHPQLVIDFQEQWWEAIDLFRDNYEDAMGRYAATGGLGAEDEAELDVVQEMEVENEELFNQEWDEGWIESNMTLAETVADLGGIEEAPGRDRFVTHDDIEDDWM